MTLMKTIFAGASLITCALVLPNASGTTQCDDRFQTPDGGMYAYWKFTDQADPTTDDYAGYGGTTYGDAMWINDGLEGAMSFDGNGDYVDISNPSLNVPTWEQYTVAAWFTNDGNTSSSGGGGKLIDKTIWYSDWHIFAWEGGIHLRTYDNGVGNDLHDDSRDYRDGLWHHVVVVVRGSNGELWMNGELKATSNNVQHPNNNGDLLLGYSHSGDSNQHKYWSGMIDELAIFDRALEPSEVIDLYANTIAGLHYCAAVVPPNDPCANAIAIGEGDTLFTNENATTDGPPLPPACAEYGETGFGADVWYTYTPEQSGTLTLSTCGQVDYDARLAVYEGPCDDLQILGCRDDTVGCGASWEVTFSVAAQQTLMFCVGGYESPTGEVHTGSGVLSVTLDPCPGDLDGSGDVDFEDLTTLLSKWGPCTGCPADMHGTGDDWVAFDDLVMLLGSWGPC